MPKSAVGRLRPPDHHSIQFKTFVQNSQTALAGLYKTVKTTQHPTSSAALHLDVPPVSLSQNRRLHMIPVQGYSGKTVAVLGLGRSGLATV
ncbi:MAG: hypothetical protein ACSHWY_05340, partial [Octadecabacter sp.]